MYHDIDEREYLEKLGRIDCDAEEREKLKVSQHEHDDDDFEEFDSDDEDGILAHQQRVVQKALTRSLDARNEFGNSVGTQTGNDEPHEDVSIEERGILRQELVKIMKERFLDGKDGEFFDYSFVDDNSELDDMEAVTRDVQERYFDQDVERGLEGEGESVVGGKGMHRTRMEWAAVWEAKGSVNDGDYDY
ncbi:UNVERIFIED_CONTAM: Coiled-coil domain-containing protein 97 [Siphonaria sp. JEL0065]|nr:Coiled-coil domain-containing protein 97 [Siphonaria sp. JEL0065]